MATIHRLYLDTPLGEGGEVTLGPEDTHYLVRVLRLEPGARVRVFNGRDGEWSAVLRESGGRHAALTLVEQTRAQAGVPELTLFFAPLKKARTDFVVEKATELGVARIVPVLTARTQAETVRTERLAALAKEAAEQTERLDLPDIRPARRLESVLAEWPADQRLYFCDEAGDAPMLADVLKAGGQGPAGLLVGPEGGFTPKEREVLRSRECVVPVGLGPRVLRAETAALAALVLFQAHLGDWR